LSMGSLPVAGRPRVELGVTQADAYVQSGRGPSARRGWGLGAVSGVHLSEPSEEKSCRLPKFGGLFFAGEASN
jgi:hypothetical protein